MTLYNEIMAATSGVRAELLEHGCAVEVVGVEGGEVQIRLVAAAGT